jgi:hypothetical protein
VSNFHVSSPECNITDSRSDVSEVEKSIQSTEVCLKPSGKRKAKRSFTVCVKTPKGTEEKATLKGTMGMASLRGSARSK